MRLDTDCIRDLLLCVEEHTGLRKFCHFIDLGLSDSAKFIGNETEPPEYETELLKKYDNDKLIYHVRYCIESKLISPLEDCDSYNICICDLTPVGHDFLSNIRENQNWKSVKKIAGKIGSTSLSALTSIASSIITNLIQNELNLGI